MAPVRARTASANPMMRAASWSRPVRAYQAGGFGDGLLHLFGGSESNRLHCTGDERVEQAAGVGERPVEVGGALGRVVGFPVRRIHAEPRAASDAGAAPRARRR